MNKRVIKLYYYQFKLNMIWKKSGSVNMNWIPEWDNINFWSCTHRIKGIIQYPLIHRGFDTVAPWFHANEWTNITFWTAIIIQKVKILEIWVWPNTRKDLLIIVHPMDEHWARSTQSSIDKYNQFLLFIGTFSSYNSMLATKKERRAEKQISKIHILS